MGKQHLGYIYTNGRNYNYSGGGILLERCNNPRKSRIVLLFTLFFSLIFLIYFKYFTFILDNLNQLNIIFGKKRIAFGYEIIPPIGISFFTFQVLGYFIDVYRKKITPEKNIFRYAAFVSFFPIITSGPIGRADNLLVQMQDEKGKCFSYDNICRGAVIALYGAFIKLTIANRLAVLSDTVFGDYKSYGGFILFFVSVCYTLQIYCDFSSYSLMAVGISRMLGYKVPENFIAPYFSESIQEFWRRWHISLSTWFRDYVYIPLGGSRCSNFRKNMNLLITFLVSGLWHGANWIFIFWGFLHGLYQIVEKAVKPIQNYVVRKWNINTQCFSFHFGKKLFVFNCVSIAWIFFRSNTIADAFSYIGRIVTRPAIWDMFNGKIYQLGLDTPQMHILLLALLLFIVLDYRKYKHDEDIDVVLFRQNYLYRCLFICGLFLFTLVFGMYGYNFNAQDFIYSHF